MKFKIFLSLFLIVGICLFFFWFSRRIEIQKPTIEQNPTKVLATSKIHEGEKLKFSVRWLGMEVGTAEAIVKGVEQIRGRSAYHIAAYARSNSLIDIIYPVRDEHHTYIDKEHFYTLRYEKILREGRYRADEVIDYDQENHTAINYSRKNNSKIQMFIAKNTQDQLSAAYWFRTQPMKVGEVIHIPTEADEKNWDLQVRVIQTEQIKMKDFGVFDAFQIEPMASFQGMFVRRGKIKGWIGTDEKRLPLMMKTKVPVLGTVTVVLVGYEGW